MSERYSVRYGYTRQADDPILDSKTVYLDTVEAAERLYEKAVHHATNRSRPLHGCVALWDGKWLVKSISF